MEPAPSSVLPRLPPPQPGPKPHRCDLTPPYMADNFKPKTNDFAAVAKKYEKYSNDNNTFNGKSLSDNRPISAFYQAKSRGVGAVHQKQPIVDQIRQDQRKHLPDPASGDAAAKPHYSQRLLDQLYDEDVAIKVSKNPSNLTEVPRVHEKYEINSFYRVNPQYRANLKTMEIISNAKNNQAVLNLNAGLFGGVSERAKQPVPLKDPFSDILEKQPAWSNVNKQGVVAGSMCEVEYIAASEAENEGF